MADLTAATAEWAVHARKALELMKELSATSSVVTANVKADLAEIQSGAAEANNVVAGIGETAKNAALGSLAAEITAKTGRGR